VATGWWSGRWWGRQAAASGGKRRLGSDVWTVLAAHEEGVQANLLESWVKVPPDMIPSEAKQAARDIRTNARRRSSFSLVAKEGTRTVLPVS